MQTKFRYEFKKDPVSLGWVKLSNGTNYLSDVFAKPIEWGLFVWNSENIYQRESAVSLHTKEVESADYVCRPTKYKQ